MVGLLYRKWTAPFHPPALEGLGVGVRVDGPADPLGAGVWVVVGDPLVVGEGAGVRVGDGVKVAVCVRVGVNVLVGVGVRVGEGVLVAVGVREGVGVGVAVKVAVAVGANCLRAMAAQSAGTAAAGRSIKACQSCLAAGGLPNASKTRAR
jgi:hypothetical protein